MTLSDKRADCRRVDMLSSPTGRCWWQSDIGQGQPGGLGRILVRVTQTRGSIYRRLLFADVFLPERLNITTQPMAGNSPPALVCGRSFLSSLCISRTMPSELWLCADQSTHDNLVLTRRGGHFGLGDPTPMPLNYV
jgi:hypothetical protein